ncbi:rhodanese-like domain-containing protein [Neobacillus sp. WH10]|uniref:rhodanese-like domain-containing protein n=1 Tax=Neobacillus sp. WH10 TaxID=3047873 RepID=UPI0024C1C08A|nr:rhodanese-like domain-containing protein [Neobacillus sp. WH10]WHY78547.1 rhodanese-like domain-containing protein [Neobacillus sp. WH10]
MTYKKITPKELHERLKSGEKVLLLDVRAEEKFNEFHIKESRNLPKTNIFQLDEKQDAQLSLPKDQEIIVTCTTGNSASKCAAILDTYDYHVTVLDGGLTAWKAYKNSLED